MPGIHLCCQQIIPFDTLSEIGDELCYKSSIKISEWIKSRNLAVLFSSYDGYPCSFFDTRDYLILIEGLIYDKGDREIKEKLIEVGRRYLAGEDYKAVVANFMTATDGDYLILIYFKARNEIVLFNDRWGRLPVFYTATERLFALSRELKFILPWIPSIELDKNILAQFLIFEFSFGQASIIKGIKRLLPGTVIQLNVKTRATDIETLVPVDLSQTDWETPPQELLERCYTLYTESIKSRVNLINKLEYKITADLSAGFDTRAVVSGLKQAGAEFTACTDNIPTGDESLAARKVAAQLGVEHLCFSARHPIYSLPELARLTYLTDGQINCFTTVTCFYDDLEREKRLTGRYANFMGFGGEFIRHPLKPKSGYNDLVDMLADDAFSSFLDVDTACRLLDLNRNEFLDKLGDEIYRYPEQTLPDRMKRLFFELHQKQVIGGEDRHRLFRWTVQPLWGSYLFDYEMHNIPLDIIDDDFFLEFLHSIDPRMLSIPFQNKHMAPGSKIGRSFLNLERRIIGTIRDKRSLSKAARSFRELQKRGGKPDDNWYRMMSMVSDVIDKTECITDYFDAEELNEFVNNCRDQRKFYQVLTLVLYINELHRRFPIKLLSPNNS